MVQVLDQVDWLARFRAGDPEILGLVYLNHVTQIEARLRRRCFTSRSGARLSVEAIGVDVADLVQEVFLHAFRPRARLAYDSRRPYANYLYMIARNILIDLLRASRRRVTTCPFGPADPAAAQAPEVGEDSLTDEETRFSIARHLASLPPILRQLHELRYVAELSQDEAAAALGTTRQRLRTLEKRLLDGLRDELADRPRPVGPGSALGAVRAAG
jgi:RNA polymerase sigma factor (sigma-70 family)